MTARFDVAAFGRTVVLALIVLLFVYPLVHLLILPLLMPLHTVGDWPAVTNALYLAIITGLIAAPLGGLLAGFVTSFSGSASRIAVLTLWALFLAPSYVLTTGWIILFSHPALRSSLPGQLFFGSAGLILLYVLKALPFSAFAARATLAGSSAALTEAARVHGLSPVRRLGIQLRLLAPALALGFTIAVVETMQEFGIPATLGASSHIPLLITAIYQRLAQVPTDYAGAAVLCWRLVFIAGVLALASMAMQRHNAALRSGRIRQVQRHPPSRTAAAILTVLLTLLLIVGFVVPAAALAQRGFGAGSWATPHLNSVLRSLGFGIVGGALALLIGCVLLKLRAASTRQAAALINVAMLANIAVPGLILGASYIVSFNNPTLPLYGTTVLLIVAYAAGTIPLALRMVQGTLADMDRNFDAAARLHGLSLRARMIDIEAALLAEPIGYGFLVAAGAIMFELPISELLYPPGATPLGVAIVFLDQMGEFGAAARLALFGLGAVALFAGVLMGALHLLAAPRRAMSA